MSKQDNKDKLRVYEYAKSLNMSSKEIITILKRLDMPVNNHMSVMENNMVDKVEGFFKSIKENAAAKRAQETNAARQQAKPAGNPAGGQQSARPQGTPGGRSGDALTRAAAPQTANQNNQEKQGNMNVTTTQSTTTTTTTTTTTSTPANAAASGASTTNPASSGGSSRPQGGQGGHRDQRPSGGQGQGRGPQGGYGQNRGPGQGQGGARPQGQGQNRGPGQGGQGQNRGPGQGQGGQSQNRGPQGARPSQGGAPGGFRSGGPSQGGQGGGFRSSAPGGTPGGGGSRPAPSRFGDNKPAGRNDANSRGAGRPGGKPGGGRPGGGNSRFEDGRGGFKNGRGGKNNRGRGQQQVHREKIDNTPKKIIVRGEMSVGDLAKLLHKDASEVIKKLIFLGVMATINQELDLDTIQLVAGDYGVEVEIKLPVDEDTFETVEEVDEESELETRPPVVTIMGHVDHGKTTLLDAIRETSVSLGEAGGITQHIGAYQVEINSKKITFLDTPGHEAFTTMRARGAQVTDITILVVAADDGVMPQTVEAINHAKAAGVPIIVAVNKIDKEGANPDKIMQALTEYELVPEAWGGETIFVNISAKQRTNLEELLEMILLVAEVNDYKANPNKRARGTVIEAELDKGKGPVARILVQHGSLKVGDAFVAGNCFGRIRAMVNDKGRRLKEAGPSTPVEITGLTEVPQAGDPFMVFEDERKARAIAERRATKHRESARGANTRVTLDDLYNHIKEGEIKDLNVIIKADVQGSAEALKGSLAKIDVEGVRVKILHSGVGAVTESDVTLASASNAIIIGFNVRPEPQAKMNADQEQVDIRLHSIIYKVIDEIEHAMKGMLDPVFKEVVIGHAEVRNLFKVSKVGTIAGCMVTDGKVTRASEARVVRGGTVVHEGKIDSLKRYKDDAKEVAQGYECGITLVGFNDLQEGDTIEAFIMETVER